jgi:hypothetical protein
MGEDTGLLRQALSGVTPSPDAFARTLERVRRRERRRRLLLVSMTLMVFIGAGAGLVVLVGTGGPSGPGKPEASAPSGSPAATPPITGKSPTPFVPAARQAEGRTVLPVTFPDGSAAELIYPADLELADMGLQPDVAILDRRDPAPRAPLVFLHRGEPGPDVLEGSQPVERTTTPTGSPVEIWRSRPQSTVVPDQLHWVIYKLRDWTVLAPASDVAKAQEVAGRLDGRQTGDGSVVMKAEAPLELSREFGEGGGAQLALGDRNPRPEQVDAGRRFRLVLLSPMRSSCTSEGLSPSGESASKCLRAAAGVEGTVLATISGDRPFVERVFDGLRAERVRLAP